MVRDDRRPPFCWVSLESLRVVRDRLPATRQAGARDALLALAEAASLRRDGHHRSGDTLRDLARLAGMSERRLRDHLRELESLGLVRVEARRDDTGRDLPTVFALLDPAGGDKSSDRGDEPAPRGAGRDDKLSGPTRARVTKEEKKSSVRGGRQDAPDPALEDPGSRCAQLDADTTLPAYPPGDGWKAEVKDARRRWRATWAERVDAVTRTWFGPIGGSATLRSLLLEVAALQPGVPLDRATALRHVRRRAPLLWRQIEVERKADDAADRQGDREPGAVAA